MPLLLPQSGSLVWLPTSHRHGWPGVNEMPSWLLLALPGLSARYVPSHGPLTYNRMDGLPSHLSFDEDIGEVAEDRDGGEEMAGDVVDHTRQSLQRGGEFHLWGSTEELRVLRERLRLQSCQS